MGSIQNVFTIFFVLSAALLSHYFGVIDLNFVHTPESKLTNALQRFEADMANPYSHVAIGFDVDKVLVTSFLKVISHFQGRSGDDAKASDIIADELMTHFMNDSAGVIVLDDNEFSLILTTSKADSLSVWSTEGVGFSFAKVLEEENDHSIVFGAESTDSIIHNFRSVKVPGDCRLNSETAFQSLRVALEWSGTDQLKRESLSEVPRKGNRVLVVPKQSSFNTQCIRSFFKETKDSDLVIIGGLHRLHNLNEESKSSIDQIALYLKSKSKKVLIHLELGPIRDSSLAEYLAVHLFPLCDSLGIGEDNFLVLNHAMGGPHLEVKVGSSLAVAGGVGIVNDVILHIFSTFGYNQQHNRFSRLSRVFFNSYAFQVTALIGSKKWSNVLTSVVKASQKVSQVACPSSFDPSTEGRLAMPTYFTLSRSDSSSVASVDVYNPVSRWRRKDVDFHIVPVLLCNIPKRSSDIGISASAEALKFIRLKIAREEL